MKKIIFVFSLFIFGLFSCEDNNANSECVSCQSKEFELKKIVINNKTINLKSYSEKDTNSSKFMYSDIKDFSLFNDLVNSSLNTEVNTNDIKAIVLFTPNNIYSNDKILNFEELNIENVLIYVKNGFKLKTLLYNKLNNKFILNKELSNLESYKFRTNDLFSIKDMFHYNEIYRIISFVNFNELPKKGNINLSFQKQINHLLSKNKVSSLLQRSGGCSAPCDPMEKLSCDGHESTWDGGHFICEATIGDACGDEEVDEEIKQETESIQRRYNFIEIKNEGFSLINI